MPASICLHCKSPIAAPDAPEGYCCVGCATVAQLLKQEGLERYYAFQGGATDAVALPARPRDLAWLEAPLVAAIASAASGPVRLTIDVQGIRCSACVWLIEKLFKRLPGALDARVEPGVGRVQLTFEPSTDVAAFVRELERFGYEAGPQLKDDADTSDATLTRLGICAALTLNTMVFSASFYVGLTPRDGLAFSLMRGLTMLLSGAVVAIGGWEFFSRALRGLRRGLITFELPISMGMLLAYAGSLVMSSRDGDTFAYFDTVATFTTLMLVGRWLQRRVLVQNRRRLLADDGIAGLFARRIEGERVTTIPAARVERGDALLLPAGDLLVTAATLLDEKASFSFDWINGESVPRELAAGARVPAGVSNASGRALRLRAEEPFQGSALLPLLTAPEREGEPSSYGALLTWIGHAYVPAVLGLAATAFAIWIGHGLEPAVQSATAVLVVTCPCALGLAIPLAYQLAALRLRREGLFVVRESFLDRAARVRRVAFDKTGTLTLGTLRVVNPAALQALTHDERVLLYNLACRSAHPASQCVLRALPGEAQRFDSSLSIREVAGQGTELQGYVRARLGRSAGPRGDRVSFEVNGEMRAELELEEQLRADAVAEVSRLQAAGVEVAILSGDAPERVARVARALGVPSERAIGGLSPEGKAAWLREHHGDRDTLLVGDGINDALAIDQALCSGTPAIDRPTLAARADFYFLTPGLACVREALEATQRLRRTTRTILVFALSYNALALGMSMLGRVSPLSAAVAMPASSLLILLYTLRASRGIRALASPSHSPAPAGTSEAHA